MKTHISNIKHDLPVCFSAYITVIYLFITVIYQPGASDMGHLHQEQKKIAKCCSYDHAISRHLPQEKALNTPRDLQQVTEFYAERCN